MFKLPELSIPTSFLTNTFSFNSLFILLDSTSVIIIGRPSGTATTIIVIPRVKLYSKCDDITLKLVTISIILLKLKLLLINIVLNKYESITKNAQMYPILLMNAASTLSLFFKGLSGVLSWISLAILP